MSRSESNSGELPSEGSAMEVVSVDDNPGVGLKGALETAASLPQTATGSLMPRSESNSVELPLEGSTMEVVSVDDNPGVGLKGALETAASLPQTATDKYAEPVVSSSQVTDKCEVGETCETEKNKQKVSAPNKTETVTETEQKKTKDSVETASKQDAQVEEGSRTDNLNTEERSGCEVDVEALTEHVLGLLREGGEPAALLQQNADLQQFITRLIGLLREKTELCANLDRQNSALISQAKSLRDVIAITKDLLGIRNMEVEHLHADLAAMEDSIKEERGRHNTAVERLNQAMGLNNELKKEYLNQMDLFQKLRDKYNEKVVLLTRENQRLKGIEPQTCEEDPTVKPQSSEDPTVKPQSSEDPTAKPQSSEDPTAKPQSSEDPIAKPQSSEDSTAKPQSSEDPTAKPQSSEDPTAKPQSSEDPTAKPQASENDPTALSLQSETKTCLVDPSEQPQTSDDVPTALSLQPGHVHPIAQTQTCLVEPTALPLPSQQDQNTDK